MKTFPWILVLTLTSSAFAQSPATEIRVTGEHPMANVEPATAKQLALVDAEHKTLIEVGVRLQALPDVKALQLKPNQLDAYAAAIADIQEQPTRTSATAGRAVYQVDVLLRLDAGETLRRLGRLRKDQDASRALVEVWQQGQALYRQLSDQTQRLASLTPGDAVQAAQEQRLTLTTFRVKHLTAQVIAALARTEERPVGGRAPSKEGRDRAKQLAASALAMAPDSPDAHYANGHVLMDAGDHQAAETAYRKALLGNPASSSGHIRLANALLQQQKGDEAITELREALRLDPKSVVAHTDLGLLLRAQQNISGAVAE